MSKEHTTVDFVAEGDTPDEWRMVLVEEGPWKGSIEAELRRLQERMYGCIDAALDGQLAENFPKSLGKRVVIQVDCYNVPRAEVDEFFQRFSAGVLATDDYREALQYSKFVNGIDFKVRFDKIH